MHVNTASPAALESPALPLQPRLMAILREAPRLRRCSLKTEKDYTRWVKRYLRFHHMRHPKEMRAKEVTTFLSLLQAHVMNNSLAAVRRPADALPR